MAVQSLVPFDRRPLATPRNEEPRPVSEWEQLPDAKKQAALAWTPILRALEALRDHEGLKERPACEHLARRIAAGAATADVQGAAVEVARRGDSPSWNTLWKAWKKYQEKGLIGLAPQYKGRMRAEYAWAVRAQRLFDEGQNRDCGDIAWQLQDEGHADATTERVRAVIDRLPADHGRFGKQRVGKDRYRLSYQSYTRRDREVLPVGLVYEGDGWQIHVYCAHPVTGKRYRPELTAWIDIRTRKIVGWWFSQAESAYSSLFAISAAMTLHNHVPSLLHVDRGSGFCNRLMNGDEAGWLHKFHIELMPTQRPKNPNAKGDIEGWFAFADGKWAKKWATYCGKDASEEFIQELKRKITAKEITLPSYWEVVNDFRAFVERYNRTPQVGLGGKSPDDLWQGLEPIPLVIEGAAILRPREPVKVTSGEVRFDNRHYTHPYLHQLNGQRMLLEYDLFSDKTAALLTLKGEFRCDVTLVEKKPWLSASRIEDAQRRSMLGAIERKQKAIEEIKARAGLARTHEHDLAALDAAGDAPALPEAEQEEAFALLEQVEPEVLETDGFEIDIYDTSYLE